MIKSNRKNLSFQDVDVACGYVFIPSLVFHVRERITGQYTVMIRNTCCARSVTIAIRKLYCLIVFVDHGSTRGLKSLISFRMW